MSSTGSSCPSCGWSAILGQQFCTHCGVRTGSSSGSALPVTASREFANLTLAGSGRPTLSRAQDRTKSGLLLMILGFAVLWIPYIGGIGGLIALIGVVLLWVGRGSFGSSHHRAVWVGSACVLVSLVLAFGVALWFVFTLITAAQTPGQTISAFGSELQSDLVTLLVTTLVASAIASMGYVALPYALADRGSRALLWGAFTLSVLTTVVGVALLWPQISTAISQATSGSTVDLAPIRAIQTQSTLWGTLQVVPDMMFLWAYYRIRNRVFPDRILGQISPPADQMFGRVGG